MNDKDGLNEIALRVGERLEGEKLSIETVERVREWMEKIRVDKYDWELGERDIENLARKYIFDEKETKDVR